MKARSRSLNDSRVCVSKLGSLYIQYETPIMSEITNASGLVLDSMVNALGAIKSEMAADYLLEIYTNNTVGSSTKVEILRYFSITKNTKGENICQNAAQNAGEPALVRYMGVVALGAYPSAENYEIKNVNSYFLYLLIFNYYAMLFCW